MSSFSGLYDGVGDCQCNWSPNHALTAVAYGTDFFVIKNSWGRTWGKNYLGSLPLVESQF